MSARFDKFMIHVDIGTDEKLAGFSDSERLCHIAGVLAIAAKSPMRGCLVVGDVPASPSHVAKRAGVTERVAKSTLRKLTDVGVLVRDDELDCLRVHNWERFNPPPKQDTTSAERQARYRERMKERGIPLAIPKALRKEVLDRDGHACVDCGSTEDLHLDHIIPKTKGGATDMGNLTVRCGTCNRTKGDRTVTPKSRARHAVTRVTVTPASRPSHADEGEGEAEVTPYGAGLASEVVGDWSEPGDPGPVVPTNVVDILDGKTIQERGVA